MRALKESPVFSHVEAHQATSRMHWRALGFGGVVMLIGTAALATHSFGSPVASPSSSNKPSHDGAFAFNHAPSAFGRAGLRQATNARLPAKMLLPTSPWVGARPFMKVASSPFRRSSLIQASAAGPDGWMQVEETLWGPEKMATERIEGGETLKTFKLPLYAERVQYLLVSPSNRPVRAKVELWIGPQRCVHEHIYTTSAMDNSQFGLRVNLKFKKGVEPVLKVSTDSTFEFPLLYGVFVPTPEESASIDKITTDMFYNAPMKEKVQGGSTIDNKGGAIRSFNIDPTWEKTQIMVWSKDVGKKSFKTNIEILQGPNNPKQFLNLRCGGSTQPFHCVIDTPGAGWMVRCNSKKYLEDGLFEIACAPFGQLAPEDPMDGVVMGGGDVSRPFM